MRLKWIKKILNSIFTKLLLVMLITGVLINFAVGAFFVTYRTIAGRPFHRNINQYLNYVIDDLGTPPSYQRARELAQQAALQIHYLGPGDTWSTSGAIPNLDRIHFRKLRDVKGVRSGHSHGRFFAEFIHSRGHFLFELSGDYEKNTELRWLHVLLLLLLTLILVGAFFSIRRILRPVKWLDEGVKEVSRGNLMHNVPVQKTGELGELAAAFNTMTTRLREMLKAKEQLLRDVSHELRSPLTRMKVALEFLPEDQPRKTLRSDVLEMEEMITAILETARIHHAHSQINRRPIDLATILKEVVAMYQNQPPGIEMAELSQPIECGVDPEQMNIALKNILDNAVKYSRPDSDPVRISLDRRPSQVVIRIEDDGVGIADKELSYILEPFYRVDKSRSKKTAGYGLGLSLCKTIIEAHGGKIEISSASNRGTTVSLYIPTRIS